MYITFSPSLQNRRREGMTETGDFPRGTRGGNRHFRVVHLYMFFQYIRSLIPPYSKDKLSRNLYC
jgi:hypothetical protein